MVDLSDILVDMIHGGNHENIREFLEWLEKAPMSVACNPTEKFVLWGMKKIHSSISYEYDGREGIEPVMGFGTLLDYKDEYGFIITSKTTYKDLSFILNIIKEIFDDLGFDDSDRQEGYDMIIKCVPEKISEPMAVLLRHYLIDDKK